MDVYTTSVENVFNDSLTPFDSLVLNDLSFNTNENYTTYQYLIESCNYISRLTDGNAMLIFQKINGNL